VRLTCTAQHENPHDHRLGKVPGFSRPFWPAESPSSRVESGGSRSVSVGMVAWMRVGEKKNHYVARERAHMSGAMARRERWNPEQPAILY